MENAAVARGDDPSVVRLPPNEWLAPLRREPAWDLYGSTIWSFEFEPSAEPPVYEVKLHRIPGLGIAYSTSSKSRVRRAAHHLVNDDLVLRVNLAGSRTLSQCGREAVIGEGEAVLSSGAEISAATTTASRFVSYRVPFKSIKALVPDVEDCVARTIPRDNTALRLLTGYSGMLGDADALATPELQRLAVTHVYDLVALTIGATRDRAEIASLCGARAARLREIKADIERNIGEQDLSIGAVAARHRLPVRYVQRLFEADGVTFTEFVLERRLVRAHRLLSDPRLGDWPIGTISFEAGFTNQPHFNRAFRSRFGAAPSDVRAQARNDN